VCGWSRVLGRLRLTVVFTLFTAHYGLVHGIGGIWLGVCLFGCGLDRLVSFVYNWLFSFLRGCISRVNGGHYDDEHSTVHSAAMTNFVVYFVVCFRILHPHSEEYGDFLNASSRVHPLQRTTLPNQSSPSPLESKSHFLRAKPNSRSPSLTPR
jgi:hypothetical protein